MNKRGVLFAGESGMGVDSSGDILMKALAHKGYRISADREYPSLIKGGQATYKIFLSIRRIRSASGRFDVGIGLGKGGLLSCLDILPAGSLCIHNCEKRAEGDADLQERAKKAGCELLLIPTRTLLLEAELHLMFENTLFIGAIASYIGLSFQEIQDAMFEKYGKKKSLREKNLFCLDLGYTGMGTKKLDLPDIGTHPGKRLFIEGNTALALGALHAGVRTYFAYPMSPSTSILGYIAATASQTGIVVKQVEDEITAAQMSLGSMYAGARSLTATSGGGFDLMTETVSLSGMTEVPWVVIIAQRPGPATGLPTWTAQGDLNLAIYGGHGEFARIVVAVSDPESGFELIQQAYTFAELYQVPVIVLTEKIIAENRQTVPVFEQGTVPIERGLVTDEKELGALQSTDRYKITESGISKRRLPTSSEAVYFCNGDEHKEDGTLDESPETTYMIEKRIRKSKTILDVLPDPVLYGSDFQNNICFVGWGSTKSVMIDATAVLKESGISISYLHYERLFPLKTELLTDIYKTYEHIVVIENNATGQLADLIQKETGLMNHERLLKRNGRQFGIDEIIEYVVKKREDKREKIKERR